MMLHSLLVSTDASDQSRHSTAALRTLPRCTQLAAGLAASQIRWGVDACRWRTTKHAIPAILHMLHDLATCLAIVHGAGRVHRDIKPDNCMLMLQAQCWRLIDYGISAGIGARLTGPLRRCCCKSTAAPLLGNTACYLTCAATVH